MDPPQLIPVWFMLVDSSFTRTLGNSSLVEVPSDKSVHPLILEVKAKPWRTLEGVDESDLNLWRLRTPQSSRVLETEGYLANLDLRKEFPEEEDVEVGDDDDDDDDEGEGEGEGKPGPTTRGKAKAKAKGKGKAKAKGKGKATEEKDVAWQLKPEDPISLYFKKPYPEHSVSVLVQLPAQTKGTSCCAVSTNAS